MVLNKRDVVSLCVCVCAEWLRHVDEVELSMLIAGQTRYDIDDWQRNTVYKGFVASDDTVVWFWQVCPQRSPR